MRLAGLLCVAMFATNLPAADFVCPVTKPPSPAFVPPAPYRGNAGQDAFWYGDKDLWTLLPADGTWHGLPFHVSEGYFNKLFLWKPGFDGRKEEQPDITVVRRRLDAVAPAYTTHYGTNAFFDNTWQMLTSAIFPTHGCWEVAASNDNHKLTFVLSIQP
jgi:hypothetical protein